MIIKYLQNDLLMKMSLGEKEKINISILFNANFKNLFKQIDQGLLNWKTAKFYLSIIENETIKLFIHFLNEVFCQ